MEKTTQWRYTPPTHVVVAFNAALDQHVAEGGQPARLARYTKNCETLVAGMTELGFKVFLKPEIQAPIILTFHAPPDPAYNFKEFYARVRDKGFILYPGKLTKVETFRVGCIGAVGPDEMRHAVNAVRDTLREMGIRQVSPVRGGGARGGLIGAHPCTRRGRATLLHPDAAHAADAAAGPPVGRCAGRLAKMQANACAFVEPGPRKLLSPSRYSSRDIVP